MDKTWESPAAHDSALTQIGTGRVHLISEPRQKHLDRYVREFAGKHNIRDAGTMAQMATIAAGLTGRRLMYSSLTAPNGLDSGARSA